MGRAGNIECLAHPPNCLQLDASDSEPLLDASIALAELRGGYRFLFIPGEPTSEGWPGEWKRSAERRRDGYFDYAYMAIPRYPGITGELGLCAAAVGVIYSYLPDELHLLQPMPPTMGNLCPEAPSQCRFGFPYMCPDDPRPDGVLISDWPHRKASWLFPNAAWPDWREFPKEYVHVLLGLAVPLCALVLWIKRKIFRP